MCRRSAEKQLPDIEAMIDQGVDALIIRRWTRKRSCPAVERPLPTGIPIVGYDRLIEDARAFYMTFDNVGVGRMQARAVLAASRRATT